MEVITARRHGDVCEVIICRPEKMNALRDEDFLALTEIARTIGTSDARAVLVRGEGPNFCTGRDIATTDAQTTDAEALIRDLINPTFAAIWALPVPTIAAVHGHCLGGGFGIAFACDIVLVAEDARLGSPFRNIGCVADSAVHFHLRERLGHHRASELIYTGRLLTGREAADLGLVNHALPADTLLAEARAIAQHIAEGPTAAFHESKRILQAGQGFDAVLAQEAAAQGRVIRTKDAAEGFRAFQDKRKPRFIGA